MNIDHAYSDAPWSQTVKKLHVLSDASESAQAANVYLQCDKKVSLVIAKSRISPLKVTTLPRLELMGAVIATRASNFVKQYLKFPDVEVYFWTDFTITLGWIQTQPYLLKTFVANIYVSLFHQPLWR